MLLHVEQNICAVSYNAWVAFPACVWVDVLYRGKIQRGTRVVLAGMSVVLTNGVRYQVVVKRIFEYSNIRSVGHIRIFFKSHSSIRDVTLNAVQVHACTPNTVQTVSTACLWLCTACLHMYMYVHTGLPMIMLHITWLYELRSTCSLMWQCILCGTTVCHT